MSLKIDYGSEIVEHLPVSQEKILPEEYAKIAPLLDDTTDLVYPLRKYLIILVLFIVLSHSSIDHLVLKIIPSLHSFSYLVVVVKAALFAVIIYLVENLNLIVENK
jgi:hypothetical protein